MKNYKKTSISKLVARFDNELKSILINDLNNAKTVKVQFTGNHQVRLQAR